ncbi:MAG: hypothetical protein AAFN81_25410 [Bacteroidota bacterium]
MSQSFKVLPSFLLLLLCVFSCDRGALSKMQDEHLHYRSIVNRKANIYVSRAGEGIVYENYWIKYSDSDATTLLIEDSSGKEVYIQGAAVIEFTEEEVSGD